MINVPARPLRSISACFQDIRIRMLKTRNRLVNFRLTQDEYDKIQTALLTKGMRCLSDFARDAVMRYAESDHAAETASLARLNALDRRVSELEASLQEIRSALPAFASNANGGAA